MEKAAKARQLINAAFRLINTFCCLPTYYPLFSFGLIVSWRHCDLVILVLFIALNRGTS
jgi:hypothetical protein